MKRNAALRTMVVLLAGLSALQAQSKKRVAIMDFDYGTVHSGVAAIFGQDVDVGKGITDLLVEKLLAGGKYSIIERKALDKILAEQNFSNSNRADSATAAQIGKVLGVDAIIIGSITQFGRDDKNTGVGGGGYGLGRFGLGGVKLSDSKAVVAVSARLIDTSTAEILSAATGRGESQRKGTSLLGGGGGWTGGGGGTIDMTSSNFGATILGEAVNKAVDSVATQLNDKATGLPTHVVHVDGLVADVSGNTLILNVGTSGGVKVGDKLQVRRKVREIKDPATGKVLRAVEDAVGAVTITEADASSSVGTYSGAGAPKVGDTVTSPN